VLLEVTGSATGSSVTHLMPLLQSPSTCLAPLTLSVLVMYLSTTFFPLVIIFFGCGEKSEQSMPTIS
jgi:hypothetical protein